MAEPSHGLRHARPRYTAAMWFLRLFVGLVAALICLAGIGWYAVYLFTPDPRSRGVASGPTTSPLRAAPQTLYDRRQNKRSAVLGVAAAVGGVALSVEAFKSIRTGIPIQVLNEPPLDGWVALAAAVFIVVIGLWLAGAGLGVITTQKSQPGR